jgi:probable rRNA maturation factor
MIKINVLTTNVDWRLYIKNPNNFIDKKINIYNKKSKNFKKNIIFCTLMLSNSKEIKKLNQKFRKKNKSTDVLSFPFYENKEIYLGDIIINLNKIKNKKNILNFRSEFNRLWVHGLVHLFGYDHKLEKDYRKMKMVEKSFLSYID